MHKKKKTPDPFFALVIFSALVILTGCPGNNKQPQTSGIKIGEIAPAGKQVGPQILRTTNINIITYELPAENIKALEDILQMPDTGTIRYNDSNCFAANGLRASAGGFGSFDKITGLLNSAKAKKLYATTLLIQKGQPESITISRITSRMTISYIRRPSVTENAEVGPGIFELQVTARQVPGDEGLANVHITPAISIGTEGLAPLLAAKAKENDVRFYCAGFGQNMKPGDIIVLGPSGYNPDENVGISRFFTKTGTNPTVRVLVMVCTAVM